MFYVSCHVLGVSKLPHAFCRALGPQALASERAEAERLVSESKRAQREAEAAREEAQHLQVRQKVVSAPTGQYMAISTS